MFEFKLQFGCMLIVLYFITYYIKKARDFKFKRSIYYDIMIAVAPFAILFDGATAWTVNHMDVATALLNLVLHVLFFISMDILIMFSFVYMVDQTVGIKNNKMLISTLLPGLLFLAWILHGLDKLYYVHGEKTNYSMGSPVIACYMSLVVHFLMIIVLIFAKRRQIERRKIFSLTTFVAICSAALIVQIVFPESLVSSILPTFCVVGIYVCFEDPSFRRLRQYNADMVTGFATLVENRDNNTGGHIRRTKEYVRVILNEMKHNPKYAKVVTRDYMNHVANAAPMHDLGKIATPDEILQKPGKLTAEEFEIMKQHAATGGEIIKEAFADLDDEEYLQIAYEVARHHHEKWNGKGYPDGLSGKEIPLHARIMSIADVFDAVSAKRCYRDAMPIDKCFQIIEEGIGTDFDPDLAMMFLNAKEEVLKVYNSKRDS